MPIETLPIGVIVRDLEEVMGSYWKRYGIGPRNVAELGPGAGLNPEPDAVYPPAS